MKERVARRGCSEMNKNGGIITINSDVYEGSDYLLDMETSILKKKRSRGEMLYICDDDGADEGYVSFLKDLHEFWEAKFEEEDDDDPVYSAFLENLKEYGNAYMCDVSKENDVLFPIIYEEESDSANEIKRKTPQTHSGTRIREKRNVCQDGEKTGPKYAGVGKKTSTQVGENYINFLKSEQRSGPKVVGIVKKTSTRVDETYEEFLKNLHVTKESVFYEYGDQERIFYDLDNQQIAEIEPLKKVMRPPPSSSAPIPGPSTPSRAKISSPKNPTPTPTDSHNKLSSSLRVLSASNDTHKNKELSQESYSSFWKKKTKLHDDLRKPYNQKEYDDLWKQFCTKKPVSIYRDSRSGGSYRPGPMRKSYLDSYPDLQLEIGKVKSDLPKVLNLLRIFKYYMEKLPSIPHQVPKPWMDDFTKSILPEPLRRL